jgi:hypothetical protein
MDSKPVPLQCTSGVDKIQVSYIDGGDGDDKLMLCGRMPLHGCRIEKFFRVKSN